ncbi:arylsulfatase [candidate division KSB1 bacterium]|nr:arylsulfatase [candidate division KSB1 bacterium]
MLPRRNFLKTVGKAAFLSLLNCNLVQKKPNFIYILADDLGYGDLGCYGQKEIKTPVLDLMAEQGIKFTDHYAGSTVCAPSRCCLMTGMDSGHAQIRGNGTVPLRESDRTIAEILKSNGYKTGLVGKWGLGEKNSSGEPTKKGFDYFFGYLNQIHAHNYYPDFLWENEDKIPLNNKVKIIDSGYAKGIGGAAEEKNVYAHDLLTYKALEFIENNCSAPFFLYLAYTIPHANNEAQGVLGVHGMEVPEYGIYKNKNWPEAQKGHAAMITRMDHDIGRLIKKLQELQIDRNTLVIFSSDNGPHREGGNDPDFNDSNSIFRGIKRDLYDGGIRVPMIARWPGKIKSGLTSDLPCAFWDILPTLAEFASAQIPPNINGISLVPTLTRGRQKKHDYLYWEFHEGKASHQAIRLYEWKGIRKSPDGKLELYNIESDPGETNNIAKQHPDIVKKLELILNQGRTESEHWPLKFG